MSGEPEALGPHDILAEGIKIERKRVPITVRDAQGNKIVVGEADAWLEGGVIKVDGSITDPTYADHIRTSDYGPTASFSTDVDFTASIPVKGGLNGTIPAQKRPNGV